MEAQPQSRRGQLHPLKANVGDRRRPLSLGELLAAICGLVFDPGAKIVDVCVRRVRRQRASIR